MRIDPGGSPRDTQPTQTAVTVHSTEKKGTNANLSFRVSSHIHIYRLWVTKVSQTHELNGEKHQGLKSSHFYAKSYAPGKIQLDGQHDGQEDLQGLATFIRVHHEALINHVGGFDTQNRKRAQDSDAFGLLMYLTIPTEAIACRGYVDKFTIERLGTVERTPEFSFPFTVVYDINAADFARSRIRVPTPFTPQPKETK
jgi:hypothetical protein